MQTVSTCCAMFDPCLLPWPLPSRAGGDRKGKGRKALLRCVRLQPGHHHSVPPAVAAAFVYQHFSTTTIFPSAGKFSYQQKKIVSVSSSSPCSSFHFSWSTPLFSSLMKSCFPHPLNINSFLVLMSQHTPFYMAGRKEKILSLIPDNFQ